MQITLLATSQSVLVKNAEVWTSLGWELIYANKSITMFVSGINCSKIQWRFVDVRKLFSISLSSLYAWKSPLKRYCRNVLHQISNHLVLLKWEMLICACSADKPFRNIDANAISLHYILVYFWRSKTDAVNIISQTYDGRLIWTDIFCIMKNANFQKLQTVGPPMSTWSTASFQSANFTVPVASATKQSVLYFICLLCIMVACCHLLWSLWLWYQL